MTTIFWDKKRIYADSNIVDGSDKFASLTKVRKLNKPIPFKSTKLKIDDVVYGYVVTGTILPADNLVKMVAKFGEVDSLMMLYQMVGNLGLSNFENHFEVIFIGAKANYSVTMPDEDERTEPLKIYGHKENFVLGSGTVALKKLVAQTPNPNPIRLMYGIYAKDPASSGMIDIWELRTKKGVTSFERIGICRGLEERNALELTQDMYAPYPFDWVLNPRAIPLPPAKVATNTKLKRSSERMPIIK